MPSRQLVGQTCARCGQRITWDLDGRFCDTCHSAVHNACAQSGAEDGRCPQCGADAPWTPPPPVVPPPVAERPKPADGYPVSAGCPECGGRAYRTRRPDRFLTFVSDRVCTDCGTRYTPPTPRWAAVVFLAVGVPLAGISLLSIALRLASGNPLMIPGIACEGFLGALGGLAVVQGVRALWRPGQV